MIEIHSWLPKFLQAAEACFGERIFFLGLQGSYARGEARENSDLDLVLILDELSPGDIQSYNDLLNRMPHRNLLCGFLSGKEELLHWDAADLFQFYYDTKAIKGSLDILLALLDEDAIKRAIQVGVCNIYHGCIHNMLYEKSEDTLKGLYKAASFVVQAICFRQTGRYIHRQQDLLEIVNAEEKNIVQSFLDIKHGCVFDFQNLSEQLFLWSKACIQKM